MVLETNTAQIAKLLDATTLEAIEFCNEVNRTFNLQLSFYDVLQKLKAQKANKVESGIDIQAILTRVRLRVPNSVASCSDDSRDIAAGAKPSAISAPKSVVSKPPNTAHNQLHQKSVKSGTVQKVPVKSPSNTNNIRHAVPQKTPVVSTPIITRPVERKTVLYGKQVDGGIAFQRPFSGNKNEDRVKVVRKDECPHRDKQNVKSKIEGGRRGEWGEQGDHWYIDVTYYCSICGLKWADQERREAGV
jgi:hypothetical protein